MNNNIDSNSFLKRHEKKTKANINIGDKIRIVNTKQFIYLFKPYTKSKPTKSNKIHVIRFGYNLNTK